MIWQYLKQDITSAQADKAYAQVLGNHYKLNREYLKKSSNKELEYKITCAKKNNLLKISDDKCLDIAFTPYKAIKMSNTQRDKLSKKITSQETKDLLKIQSEPNSENAYIKYDPSLVLKMFTTSGSKYRREKLNINFSQKFINRLAKSSTMSRFISTVVRDNQLDNLQKSILKIDAQNISSRSNFLLALHSLKNSKKEKALLYLQASYEKAKKRKDKDRAVFWMYQATKDKAHLHKLLLSMDINIYTLQAHDILDIDVVNFFTSTQTNNKLSSVNLKNPFEWDKIKSEIKSTPNDKLFELSKKYEQKNMIPVNRFVLEKAYRFNVHGYVMPYDEYLSELSIDEKALVYSIMRQESNYIPSALSRSFALGLMQIMPFLVDALAKELKEKIEYKEMFIPQKNIKYSLKHLKWMRRSLSHPLMIAYGYNGGTGFLRKHLKTGAFKEGQYEPYLSMEMMSNSETREYGKRVVANYVMYKKILGEEISIVDLLNSAIKPKKVYHSRG